MNHSPAQTRAPSRPDGGRAPEGYAITVTDGDDEAAFSCLPGETVLFAGQAAGWDLPYECASGGCGTCRAQLLSGYVTSSWPDASGLTERDAVTASWPASHDPPQPAHSAARRDCAAWVNRCRARGGMSPGSPESTC
jgi:ferredoxin